MKLLQFAALGVLLEGIAIYAFITVSKSDWAVPGKQIITIFFLISIIVLFSVTVRSFSFFEQLLLSWFLTAGFVVVYQFLGFTLFPGLVKDITPFSSEHFRVTFIFTCILFGIFNLIAIVVFVIGKKIILK